MNGNFFNDDSSSSLPLDLFPRMLPSQLKTSRTLTSISSWSEGRDHVDSDASDSIAIESVVTTDERPEIATGNSCSEDWDFVRKRTSGDLKVVGRKKDDWDSGQGDTSGLGSTPETIKQKSIDDSEANPIRMLEVNLSDSDADSSSEKDGRTNSTREANGPGSFEDLHQAEERRKGESPGEDGMMNQAIDNVDSRSPSDDSSDDAPVEEVAQLNPKP